MNNSTDTIEHFGVKGMRWGHRNRKEYLTKKYISKGYNPRAAREKAKKRISTEGKIKKAALIGGGVALAGLAAYGGYRGIKDIRAKQALRRAEGEAVIARIKEGNKRLREQEQALRNMWGKPHDDGVRIQERFKQKAQFVNAFNAANAAQSQSNTGRKIKDVTNSISKSAIGTRPRKLLN